ncbi:hypothetical protein LY76DRAFT_364094 [Colletotrichum caudatum]|nr:hypothetical protein LY76DRAFT_364094 [Colletotrichum caudatum]
MRWRGREEVMWFPQVTSTNTERGKRERRKKEPEVLGVVVSTRPSEACVRPPRTRVLLLLLLLLLLAAGSSLSERGTSQLTSAHLCANSRSTSLRPADWGGISRGGRATLRRLEQKMREQITRLEFLSAGRSGDIRGSAGTP